MLQTSLLGEYSDLCSLFRFLGLNWAPCEVSVFSVYSGPGLLSSPVLPRSNKLCHFFYQNLGPVSWLVHMCPCVGVVYPVPPPAPPHIVLAPLPSSSQMSLPWPQTICHLLERPGRPSDSRWPLALRVCFAEWNVNPSPEGLLDLFN